MRCVGKLPLPVRQLALAHTAGQRLRFPRGMVQCLQIQPRQLDGQALRARRVEQAQLVHQHPHGPAVAHAVVQGPQQAMVQRAQADQRGAYRRLGRQVKGAQAFRGGQGFVLLLQRLRGGGVQQHFLHAPIVQRLDALARLALHVDPAGAQYLVALHQRVQAVLQDAGVQRATQLQRHRHVVQRRAGRQLLPEPHALLGRRQGQQSAPLGRGESRD